MNINQAALGTIDGGEYVAARVFDEVRQIHHIVVRLLSGHADVGILPEIEGITDDGQYEDLKMKDVSNWQYTDQYGWLYDDQVSGWVDIYPNHMTDALAEAFNLPTGY